MSYSLKRAINIMHNRLSNLSFVLYEILRKKENISLEVPYIEAEPGDCGIGCVVMMLQYLSTESPNVKQLSNKYKKKNYYGSRLDNRV